jgi:ubiquinone/menaquinone biosynthesis C-methylase UbiE/DNA-binding transcriptional ArsR family regulator
MPLPSTSMLDILRAVGEETRLRIVALLQHGELTVSDLTEILGQSQPRISRHLKLLHEAGVVDKHREGTWVFFDLIDHGPIGQLLRGVLAELDPHDTTVAADLDRLENVRSRRVADAQRYFAEIAPIWDQERSLHAPDELVEAAILDALGDEPHPTVLDLGTGTGRMLQLIDGHGDGFRWAVGLDNSHSMLSVARANLGRAEVHGVDLRQGDVYSPPVERDAFDLVVIHQVLHYLDDPARAVREAARLVAPGGRLLIVDFAPHGFESLRTEHAHRRLGFRDELVGGWLEASGLDVERVTTIDDVDRDDDMSISVSLWLGRVPASDQLPARSAIGPNVRERPDQEAS